MASDENGSTPFWLTPKSAAARLDVSVSELRKLIRTGRLRARRIRGSRMLRLAVSDLDALLEPVDAGAAISDGLPISRH